MTTHPSILGNMSVATFLADYWQKKPLVIRQGYAGLSDFLPPEELAGLSLEDQVESRLIELQRKESQWQFKQGPLCEQDFLNLPEFDWTLLIQGFDYWVPESRSLINRFNFIPNWRLDDLMVSFATEGGGVGPHLDQYDVFLVQGQGKRRWQVGERGQPVIETRPHPSLKQIEEFAPIIDEELCKGDILYIPPNTPHWGIAVTDCITYSVGFRAPSSTMVMEQLLLDLLEKDESSSPRYQDQFETELPTEALPKHLTSWLEHITDSITQRDRLIAFGKLVTRLKNDIEESDQSSADIKSKLIQLIEKIQLQLTLAPESRVTYQIDNSTCHFWINGEYLDFPIKFADWIATLCKNRNTSGKNVNISLQDIEYINRIANLYKRGWLFFNHSKF